MRTFIETLRALQFGETAEQLDDALHMITTDVVATGKPAEMTLRLKLKPGKAGQIEIADDIRVKRPERDAGMTIMFPTPEGYLQREDPRQGTLEGLTVVQQPRRAPQTMGEAPPPPLSVLPQTFVNGEEA